MKKIFFFVCAKHVHTHNECIKVPKGRYISNRVSVEINYMGRTGMWLSNIYLETSRLRDRLLALYTHKQYCVSVCVGRGA